MAETTNTKRPKKDSKVATTTNVEVPKEEVVITVPAAEDMPIVPKSVDPDEYVTVHNGHHGILIYKSKRTGEVFTWDEYGEEQEMQIRELKDAKNSNKKFFINNWFVFDEDYQWVIDYLGMRNFYRNSIGLGKFDDIFKLSPAELKAEIENMSDGQKSSISCRARQLIIDGEIDSRKIIATLEETLGVELIEK